MERVYRLRELAAFDGDTHLLNIFLGNEIFSQRDEEGKLRRHADPENRIRIEVISVNEDGSVIVYPGKRESGAINSLAVLMHQYGVRTDPESAMNYGPHLMIQSGQLPRVLAILAKKGIDKALMEEIAQAEEIEIPSLRGVRKDPHVVEENFNR